MALTLNHDLHFQCTFRLRRMAEGKGQWSDVAKATRHWINRRLLDSKVEMDESFGSKWFFAGGDWRPKKTAQVSVRTRCAVGSGTESTPEFWSLRYEIPDSQVKVNHRHWRTDIGVTTLSDQEFQFSLRNAHWIAPNYIGEEPERPLPSAPGIIPILLTSKLWRAYAGDQSLSPQATPVREGKANEFVDRLMSPKRGCPCVLVAKEYSTNKPLIDSTVLAKLLAGVASVYESESTLLDHELEHLLDYDYRCWNGRVRVYQPQVHAGDGRRHRYFTKEDIQELGADEVQNRIIQGIARRSQLALGVGVVTLEDVDSRHRESRLAQLQKDGQSSEYLKLYQEEVDDLSFKLKTNEDQIEYWKGQAEEVTEFEDQIRRLEYDRKQLEERAAIAEIRAEAANAKASLIENMEDLPNEIEDVVRLVAKAFYDRIVFTGRAVEDAKKCNLKNPNIAWRCLRSMATLLHRLHFGEKLTLRETIDRFQNETVFELAATESQTTKNNKKLAKQRKGFYRGREQDFSTHVKYGRDPGNSLRVHYLADMENELIVVDRCGDHLDLKRTN